MATTTDKTERKDDQAGGRGTQALAPGKREQESAPAKQRERRSARPMIPIVGPLGLMRRLFDDLAQLAGVGNEPGPAQKEQAQGPEGMMFSPRVDVTRRDGKVVVQVDLPGVAPENISAVIEDDALLIEGERRDERQFQEGNVWRSERIYGRFQRVIPLPEGVDTDSVEARFENGVLEIALRAPEQKRSGKQIDIKSEGQTDESRRAKSH
ncbi:MAG: heat shock protein Hsp20 [Myxococcales bacterium]|nr:heat shock protein Hsp20 [Myxococcales bacterium]